MGLQVCAVIAGHVKLKQHYSLVVVALAVCGAHRHERARAGAARLCHNFGAGAGWRRRGLAVASASTVAAAAATAHHWPCPWQGHDVHCVWGLALGHAAVAVVHSAHEALRALRAGTQVPVVAQEYLASTACCCQAGACD